jgi:hypothetical protein
LIKDYTVWKFYGETEDSSAFDGGRKSSTVAVAAANAEPQTSSVTDNGHGSATTHNVEHDYIMMADLLQDMADGDEGYDDNDELVRETVELFESIANRLDDEDILFGSPKWLENFREMKQAAIDPLIRTVRSTERHYVLTSKC